MFFMILNYVKNAIKITTWLTEQIIIISLYVKNKNQLLHFKKSLLPIIVNYIRILYD